MHHFISAKAAESLHRSLVHKTLLITMINHPAPKQRGSVFLFLNFYMVESLYNVIQLFSSGKTSTAMTESFSVKHMSETYGRNKGAGKKMLSKFLMSKRVPGVENY